MIWLCTALLGGSLIWAFTARLDQTVSLRGRLEPAGSVREVDSPSGGVVSKVYVRDGQIVNVGTPLFDVEAKGLASRRQATITTIRLLELQAQGIKGILQSEGDPRKFKPIPPLPLVDNPVLFSQLSAARQQITQLRSQLSQISARLASRRESLLLQERIAKDLTVLFRNGGIARNQYLTQLDQVQAIRTEVISLEEERVKSVGQAAGQLNEINRQLLNLKAELVATRENLSYRTVRAPIAGKVFDSKLYRYAVINADQTVLKLVPANRLQASVEISDADIGFMKLGLPATVSIDSFPSGEFGYINGTLTKIGSDALPPDPKSQQYRFPATVTLRQQGVFSGENKLNLQSGMGVTANIRLRSRPVITLLSDMFIKQLDGVKRFR
ncbi:HlyD family efflux transporter periplasmic adaptor subunit [Cyanobium sp. WAJ14-Wanaka]|nr:HlyD family efflux transporter periplasmic adaptor subunit [Cyanobium sp. WAJ14-Wanaka]